MNEIQIKLANPRGFCAGVDRAIEIVERALETLGAPIYVRHEVVHNRFVVENLKQRGAIFIALSFMVSIVVVPLVWVKIGLLVMLIVLLGWFMRLPVIELVADREENH